jgi:hypothetical protein
LTFLGSSHHLFSFRDLKGFLALVNQTLIVLVAILQFELLKQLNQTDQTL